MVHGFKADYSISARLKKHFCPSCGGLLKVKKKTE